MLTVFNGKNWGEMTHLERARLAAKDPERYKHMRACWAELKENFQARLAAAQTEEERKRYSKHLENM